MKRQSHTKVKFHMLCETCEADIQFICPARFSMDQLMEAIDVRLEKGCPKCKEPLILISVVGVS